MYGVIRAKSKGEQMPCVRYQNSLMLVPRAQHEHSPECEENWVWRVYEAELLARFNILNELQCNKYDSWTLTFVFDVKQIKERLLVSY